MLKHSLSSLLAAVSILILMTLTACSPKFDWREVRANDAHAVILMPAKPATLSRPIDLNGTPVTMTMTAAEVDGVSFALGTAELADAAKAQAALSAMKTAMVKNINGSIKHEKALPSTPANPGTTIELEASGIGADGQPRLLLGRFVALDKRVYQAVVIGREKNVSREAADTFLTSFKPN
jgi:hypothetical protein